MKRVRIAELKDHLSEHLRAVEAGAVIEVTDRRRPIVRLVPAAAQTLQIVPARRPFSAVRGRRYRLRRWPVDPVEVLLAERGKR